jgi:hypothetical protein
MPRRAGGGKGYRGLNSTKCCVASTLRREAPLREPGFPLFDSIKQKRFIEYLFFLCGSMQKRLLAGARGAYEETQDGDAVPS